MNVFKRMALFVFGLTGIIALVTLMLPWVGPWTRAAASLMALQWYAYVVEGAAAVTLVGLIITLGRALLTPHNAKTVRVSKSNGDEVTVSTAAIASQAAHIVEEDREYFAEKVWVTARRRGKVRVAIRVRPAHAVDVTVEGARLHDRLAKGLAAVCGKSLDRVELEFVEPDSLDPKPDYLKVSADEQAAQEAHYTNPAAPLEATYEVPTDITVHMPVATPVEESNESEGWHV